MNNEILRDLVCDRIPDAKEDLADRNRGLLYKADQNTFDRLDFDNDDIFLNPYMFQIGNLKPEYNNLTALLFSQMQEERKPAKIEAFADQCGRIYFQGIGYLYTDVRNSKVKLQWDSQAQCFHAGRDGGFSITRQVPTFYFEGSSIEIYRDDVPPYYERFSAPDITDTHTRRLFEENQESVVAALSIIQHHFGNFYQVFEPLIRGIYMFSDSRCRSFASLELCGVSFLNSEPENSVIFFLEDILHQSSHNIFYYVLYHKDIFAINEDSPLENHVNHPLAHGEVYGTFHGLFTLCNINTCFELCLNKNLFQGDLLLELRGRFSDNMKRFKGAIEIFDNKDLFAEQGWKLYQSLKETWSGLYERNQSLIEAYDTSNQPYVFRMEKFLEANPVS